MKLIADSLKRQTKLTNLYLDSPPKKRDRENTNK